jgi:hypothetical protein
MGRVMSCQISPSFCGKAELSEERRNDVKPSSDITDCDDVADGSVGGVLEAYFANTVSSSSRLRID